MSSPLRQTDFEYDPDTRIFRAPHDTPRPWHGVEIAVADELGEELCHGNSGDLYFNDPSKKLSPDHSLNPLDRPLSYYIIGEIRSTIVRHASEQRGRFTIRREQHEYLRHRAEHMLPKYHDRYLFTVYDRIEAGVWRLLDCASVTAPEIDRTRDTWTWTDTGQYEIAQITWSQIPGLDPIRIEAEHDGYWTLDDF